MKHITHLINLLMKLLAKKKESVIHEFSKVYSIELEKKTITKMKNLYHLRKGKSTRPNSTGLLLLFNSCEKLKKNTKIISDNIETKKITLYETIGQIPNKGYVYLEKNIVLNPNMPNFKPNGYTKDELKDIKKKLDVIYKNIYDQDIVKYISEINNKLTECQIKSLKSFMQIKCTTILSGNDPMRDPKREYKPSNGEQSMLILNNSLCKEKDIYILDEPEMSVGHDYINSVIVPRIIELSKLGKTIIISTHDANIAVRTLPFVTVYRVDDEDKKKTYYGNPFNDSMINVENEQDRISWAKTCIDTLEGGCIAFRERGNYYGKENL